MKEISRIGTYAVVLDKEKILLTSKTKGPYKGLLDLPGGKIEFNETIEEALKRELKEEVAMSFSKMTLFGNYTYSGEYHLEESYIFHHIGLIYLVEDLQKIPKAQAEDIFSWYLISKISLDKLTPFAKQVMQQKINI